MKTLQQVWLDKFEKEFPVILDEKIDDQGSFVSEGTKLRIADLQHITDFIIEYGEAMKLEAIKDAYLDVINNINEDLKQIKKIKEEL